MGAGSVQLKVQVWIYCRRPTDGQYWVLLLKTGPDRGDFWQPVTGSVEPGETLEKAAIREATEESGLQFKGNPKSIGYQFEFESRWTGRAQEHGYALEIESGQLANGFPNVQLDPKEHVGYQWINAESAFEHLRHPSNVKMLKLLLEQIR